MDRTPLGWGKGVCLGAGERGGNNGLGHPQRSRVCDWPCGGHRALLGGLPAMMLGLGVYLPFYMSFTAALGAALKWVIDRVRTARTANLPADERAARDADAQEAGVSLPLACWVASRSWVSLSQW